MTDDPASLDGLEMFTEGYPPPLTNYSTEPVTPITTIAEAFADLNRAITTHQPPDHHRKTPPMTTNHSITEAAATIDRITDILDDLDYRIATHTGPHTCNVCGDTTTLPATGGLAALTSYDTWTAIHTSKDHATAHQLAAAILERTEPVTCELCGETRHLNPATATITDLIEYERWSEAHNGLAHWASLIALHGRKWECREGHSYKVRKRPNAAQIKAWRDWCTEHLNHGDSEPVNPR